MALLGTNVDFTKATSLAAAPAFAEIGTVGARTGRPRMVAVHERYFDGDLDEQAAYWLGFIFADGCVRWIDAQGHGRWVLRINLQTGDVEHLRKLYTVLGGAVAVTSRCARFTAHSRYLCARLGSLGVVPRKSSAPCEPPVLEGAALRGFLRGLFDGDGCLHVSKRGYLQAAFTGHPALVRWFVDAVGVKGSSRLRDGTLYYQWTGGRQARAVVRALYPGVPVLARKIAIAERWF